MRAGEAQPDLIGIEDEHAVIAERDLLEQKLPCKKIDAMASMVRCVVVSKGI